MKEYEMNVETVLDEEIICTWKGSELFEANTESEALTDAVMSEYNNISEIPYHRDVLNVIFHDLGFGCVYWTNPSGQRLYESITVTEYGV